MRSKIAQRIQNDTPAEIRLLVKKYADMVLRSSKVPEKEEATQKNSAAKIKSLYKE